jgi:Xaa-Pro aminopeptidase
VWGVRPRLRKNQTPKLEEKEEKKKPGLFSLLFELIFVWAFMDSIRSLLSQNGVKYLIVPSTDAHNSEYLAPQDKRRAFISGFDGSAGTALVGVSPGDSYLWTDGRYWLQASQQLNASEWHLMKAGDKGVLTLTEKLATLLNKGDKLGVDPRLITVAEMRSYQQVCSSTESTLEWCHGFIDQVWKDRLNGLEKLPAIQLMKDEISGRSVADKLDAVGKCMANQKANYLILSMLDEIAWLLNLRGSDISFNPVFFSFVVLSLSPQQDARPTVTLFLDSAKIEAIDVKKHLESLHVVIKDYNSFYDFIASHLKDTDNIPNVWIDASKSNAWTYVQLSSSNESLSNSSNKASSKCHLIEDRAPIADMKACKNDTEIDGMKKAHIEDGAALVEFFCWLDRTLSHPSYPSKPFSEHEVAEYEYALRKRGPNFVGLSFDTISSSGPNAAIIHYKPPTEGSAFVTRDMIYLNDSGGQYLNGTTDVTRTWHFGKPTSEEIDAYTRVLLGFIGLAKAKFPEGVNGFALDVLARNALWQAGMDYKHGTGHGVGHYLNVHEAPPYIGIWRGHDISKMALQPGMCTSIEPGYYEPGKFGIRIENVAFVVKSKTTHTNNGTFLEFEQLTMVPIAKNLIDKKLLSPSDVDWLNTYHAQVFQHLFPLVSPSAQAWLKEATSPL